MAPSPEYDKEPKAPDKSATDISNEDSKLLQNLANDQLVNSDHKTTNSSVNSEVENNKHVETLDDEKLRALLDEAITYKCPKDREGKSSLFKELLEEVEQDEQACEAAARVVRRGAATVGGRGTRSRRALQHSNSLQDLVAALAAEPTPRRHARHPPPPAVSARAIHGGSLPSGVDTSSLLSEEGACGRAGVVGGGGGYLATVRCVNPPPLAERRVSASDANAPHELDMLNRRCSKPMFPMTYTARATLEIGSGAVCSGRAVTTTTASNQVDAGIPFSCITSPEVVTGCSTTSSTAQTAAVALDPKPRSVIATSFNGLPLSRPNYGSTSTTANDEYKKSLDENGNAVQGYSSPLSGSSQHKKPRRKKSSKNETVIDCRQLDGYQGDKDVNELLRFIESDARDDARAPTKLRAKHKDDADDKISKKRSAERRKDKEKPPRASSLEERSRTTLEDLTAAPKTLATTPAQAPAKPERRSWGDAAPSVPTPALEPLEQADFQTVTKKRKPRRRTDEPPRRTRAPSPRPADSAPPSDRSNDSNDDMDSVHSAAAQPAALPPPAAPPHASYADIARTRHNIPDLIESCNFYAEGETEAHVPPPAVDPPAADPSYPALETATRRARDKPPPPRCARVPPAKTPPAAAAPDVLGDRRPPVILLDSTAQPRDMDGVTFGFDINEQLLGGATRRPKCDLVRDAVEAGEADGGPAGGGGGPGVPVRAGCTALRYLPPADRPPLQLIVDYVGMAWEEVMRCGGAGGGGGGSSGAPGKVRYYSE